MPSDSRRSHFLAALLGALVVALPIMGLAIGGAFSSDSSSTRAGASANPPVAAAPAPASAAPARSATDVSALYERVSPGVASVLVEGAGGAGSGSGFVLDRDGYILTNDHVVDGAQTVRVRFGEGATIGARVVGVDPSTDLALLKIDPAGHKLTPLALGSSKNLKVGQPAIAIGSPFRLDGTLTTGVISALGRSIKAPNQFSIDNVVQTDAAINPGNSGGPLLDASGRVIGINAQIATATQSNSGVGFAIPIDTAKQVLPQLKRGEQIKRAYLGVQTGDAETGTGAVVSDVVPGGPADDAGLQVGDRIVSIGDDAVTSSTDVATAVGASKPGDSVKLAIRRGAGERTLDVKLGTRPAQAGQG
ncbi:MAG TPA: trypsin-like peptidase domain-containing protein [Solirubrobacteraceae bacterium]|jgi:putative serine protease PepD|nr:trypsin-like peptidase domain-containing protein [Solirubrobacteraceae bacterium]